MTEVACFECFGVRARVRVSRPEDAGAVRAVLPPGACDDPRPEGEIPAFDLLADDAGRYTLVKDDDVETGGLARAAAMQVLERELRALVALEAPDHVFVHAGAVAHEGRAILLPGRSHAGKSTLVAALVRAGAQYMSDEYAPLAADGLVHPFAKPLSLRDEAYVQTDHAVEDLGGVRASGPLPAGLIVLTTYVRGATWKPRPLGVGETVLELLSNTVPARTRPEQALRAIGRCAEAAHAVSGDRGEADSVTSPILAAIAG